MEIVAVGLEAVPEEERVTEAVRVQDAHLRPCPLDDGIRRDRRPMDDEIDIRKEAAHGNAGLLSERLNAGKDSLLGRARSRGRLEDAEPPGLVDGREVGERPAGIYAESNAQGVSLVVS